MKMISDEVYTSEMHRLLKACDYLKRDRLMLIKTAFETFSIYERDAHLEDMERAARQYQEAKKAARVVPLEADEQKAFVSWFYTNFPTKKIMMIRNDGGRSNWEKTEQIPLGLLPGAADLYIPNLHTWVELKRTKGSKISAEQVDFAKYVREECGDKYLLCYGCEDAINQVLEVINKKACN